MAELTEQQIEQAARAAYNAQLPADNPKGYRRMVIAAAPYLQLPWDDPTDDECRGLSQNHLVDTGAVYSVLWYFVHGRNKALRPNLLDTRREKIIAILVNSAASFLNGQLADPLADKILAALDK